MNTQAEYTVAPAEDHFEVRHNGELTITRPRKLAPLPTRPPIRLEPLYSVSNAPSADLGIKMERQISTVPLVNEKEQNGLNSSSTSMDMTAELSKHKLVTKHSQVSPADFVQETKEKNDTTSNSDSNNNTEKDTNFVLAGKIITAILTGIYFGWFLQKSTVYKPETIRNQFLFKELIMFKMFFGVLLTSQFVLLLLSYIPQTKPHIEAAKHAYTSSLCQKGIISTVTGTFLLGCGMAVAGACPGMVLAQIGSLVPNSAYTVLGGIIGCLLYGLLHKYLVKVTTPSEPYTTHFIYEKIKVPYIALALPCMVLLIAALVLMDVFKPENQKWLDTKEMSNNETSDLRPKLKLSTCGEASSWFTEEMWSPSVCGVILGLIQLPIILVLTDTMGSSSGYMAITSQWVVTKRLKEMFPYMARAKSSIEHYWMVFYIIAAALGAALAALSSCTFFKASGPVWWQGLLGGFLMLFGSRLGSGCTSGHGISGAALLVGLSWIAVPSMFAGGICTAFAMEYSGTNLYVDTW